MSRHDDRCEGQPCRCFARKLRTVQFGNVTPPPDRLVEQRMDKDLPAYKRLRDQGLQPRSTRGAAELETRAESQLEVNLGKLIAPQLLRRHKNEIAEGMAIARDAGYGIDDIRQWKQKVAK